jgi:hypothetical protein
MNEFNNDIKTSNIVLFIFYLALYNFRLNNVIKILNFLDRCIVIKKFPLIAA